MTSPNDPWPTDEQYFGDLEFSLRCILKFAELPLNQLTYIVNHKRASREICDKYEEENGQA